MKTRAELEKELQLLQNLWVKQIDRKKANEIRRRLNRLFNQLYPELK